MAVYEVEMRVVEIQTYTVEAESAEQAVDLAWDDPSPTFIEHVCMELDDVTLKEEKIGEEMLTPAEYNKLRTENLDWLQGKESTNAK
jgi:hypothetical protein